MTRFSDSERRFNVVATVIILALAAVVFLPFVYVNVLIAPAEGEDIALLVEPEACGYVVITPDVTRLELAIRDREGEAYRVLRDFATAGYDPSDRRSVQVCRTFASICIAEGPGPAEVQARLDLINVLLTDAVNSGPAGQRLLRDLKERACIDITPLSPRGAAAIGIEPYDQWYIATLDRYDLKVR